MNRIEVKSLISEALLAGNTPIIHPNGFAQLKLCDGRRMHFWHPMIPRQEVKTPIHDHIFDMHSEIIAGSILHCEVSVLEMEDGYYSIYEAKAVRDAETKLVNTGHRCKANHGPWQEFSAGDEYDFPAGSFHETSDRLGPAISIITKGKEFPEMNPCVLVPADQEPDNAFTRDSFEAIAVIGMIDRVTDLLFPVAP